MRQVGRHRAVAVLVFALAACGTEVAAPTERPTARPAPTPASVLVGVRYTLTGSATGADITYTDGSGNIQQQTERAVPLQVPDAEVEGIIVRASSGDFVQFSAQNIGESGDLECNIEALYVVNNEVSYELLNTGRSAGGFAIVSCSATVP